MPRSTLWLMLCLVLGPVGATEYDARTLHSHCRAFQQPFNQGTCASCCAAAVATQLSLRRCFNFADGQDTLYSAQHIWDCAASQASGACGRGVMLDSMINAIGNGVTMVDVACSDPLSLNKDPNMTRCYTGCAGSHIGGVEQYHLYYTGVTEYASFLAAHALMNQITENGPTVAVISFKSAVDFDNFVNPEFLRGGRVFMPSTGTDYLLRHCVVVLGWGVDDASGQNYWLIQNSYGDQWADGGFARVLRGADMLEGDWRGLFFVDKTTVTLIPSTTISFSGMPSSDIIVLTFLCAIALAVLVVGCSRLFFNKK